MSMKAKSIAEQAMPGWHAVETLPPPDAAWNAGLSGIDSVGASLETLKQKYFGEGSGLRGGDAGAARAPLEPVDSEDTELVVMERTDALDSSSGRKTVLVQGNRVVGTQG